MGQEAMHAAQEPTSVFHCNWQHEMGRRDPSSTIDKERRVLK